ncbi:MAG: DinB family protein [Ignavibacteriales bacterium]|nr:DinB family protein [Ignavibacteriales bacterium]
MTLQHYLEYFDEAMRRTTPLLKSVPPDKTDWKPTDTSFTIGQQMAHMVGAIEVYAHGIARGEWGFDSLRQRFLMNRRTPSITKEDALAKLAEFSALFRAQLQALSEEEFDRGEIFMPQLNGRVPRWRSALFFLEHHHLHKGELFMSLKVLGERVNSLTLYSPQ